MNFDENILKKRIWATNYLITASISKRSTSQAFSVEHCMVRKAGKYKWLPCEPWSSLVARTKTVGAHSYIYKNIYVL
jgi:hypothetical protein